MKSLRSVTYLVHDSIFNSNLIFSIYNIYSQPLATCAPGSRADFPTTQPPTHPPTRPPTPLYTVEQPRTLLARWKSHVVASRSFSDRFSWGGCFVGGGGCFRTWVEVFQGEGGSFVLSWHRQRLCNLWTWCNSLHRVIGNVIWRIFKPMHIYFIWIWFMYLVKY